MVQELSQGLSLSAYHLRANRVMLAMSQPFAASEDIENPAAPRLPRYPARREGSSHRARHEGRGPMLLSSILNR